MPLPEDAAALTARILAHLDHFAPGQDFAEALSASGEAWMEEPDGSWEIELSEERPVERSLMLGVFPVAGAITGAEAELSGERALAIEQVHDALLQAFTARWGAPSKEKQVGVSFVTHQYKKQRPWMYQWATPRGTMQLKRWTRMFAARGIGPDMATLRVDWSR